MDPRARLLNALSPWLREGWEAEPFREHDIRVSRNGAGFLFRPEGNPEKDRARLFAQARHFGALRRKPRFPVSRKALQGALQKAEAYLHDGVSLRLSGAGNVVVKTPQGETVIPQDRLSHRRSTLRALLARLRELGVAGEEPRPKGHLGVRLPVSREERADYKARYAREALRRAPTRAGR